MIEKIFGIGYRTLEKIFANKEVKIEIPVDEIKNFLDELTANKNFLYVFIPCSIGDFLIASGLSYAVQLKKNKVATVLIAQERMKNLAVTYENVAAEIFLPMDLLKATDTLIRGTEIYERDNFIYGNFHMGDNRAYDDKLNAVDKYKRYVFDLPLDTPLAYPVIKAVDEKNISNLREKYFLDKDRTIILLPHAKTLGNLDKNFWATMAKIFRYKNFIVYTNVADDEKPVAGTLPITTNFPELFYIADKVKCFIGLRSGIFDFLAKTDAKIFNILDFPRWDWDIKFNYPNCDAKTFYDAVKYSKPLEDYLKTNNLSVRNFHHEHINSADVYFSYEDILNAIVAEVEKI